MLINHYWAIYGSGKIFVYDVATIKLYKQNKADWFNNTDSWAEQKHLTSQKAVPKWLKDRGYKGPEIAPDE